MSAPGQVQGFFRCPVPEEQAEATLVVGRKRLKGTLLERSIDGFTLLLPATEAKYLSLGSPLVLQCDAECSEVHLQWFFHAPGNRMQLGLRRLRDLTPSLTNPAATGGRVKRGGGIPFVPDLAMCMWIAIALCVVSLPGVGDKLGTAPVIRDAMKSVWNAGCGLFGLKR
jgi:hypothetical protein